VVLRGLEAGVREASGLHYMPDADFVPDWGWPLVVVVGILEVGLEGDPTIVASRQVCRKRSREGDQRAEDPEAEVGLPVRRLDGVAEEGVEAEP